MLCGHSKSSKLLNCGIVRKYLVVFEISLYLDQCNVQGTYIRILVIKILSLQHAYICCKHNRIWTVAHEIKVSRCTHSDLYYLQSG